MAFTSAFFDAELVGGEYDRVYSAEKFAEYFSSFIANGVFPDPSTNLQVVANNVNDMNVLVSPGMGWINGYYCKNDGSYPLAIQAASGTLNRTDAVVIGWSRTNREITTYIKTGTAASSPTAPSLTRNADLYELMLATITINAGVTKVTQSMIVDKRADTSVCGWVTGVVQQIDTTNLFAQYDAAFQAWFDALKAQLGDNVAANLQNQINQLKTDKVNVSDKATKAEAQAGTDDTKWMTPLRTHQMVGTAPETVKDLRTGKLIRVVSSLGDQFPPSPLTIKLMNRNDSNSTNDLAFNGNYHGFYYAPGIDKLFMSLRKSSYSGGYWDYTSGYGYLSTKALTQGVSPTFKVLGDSSSESSRADSFFGGPSSMSNDNLVKIIQYYSGGAYRIKLIDLKTNSLSAEVNSPSYISGIFATENKWGYVYVYSYGSRTLYYSNRGASTWSSISLGNSTDSNNYQIWEIGVYGENLYFIEQTSSVQWQLGKVNFPSSDSPLLTRGLATFNFTSWGVSYPYLTPLFHDQRYAYIRVHWSGGMSNRVLRVDLSNGTSNWSDFSKSSTMKLTGWDQTPEYIGTLGNKALFLMGSSSYSNNLYIVDKSTLGIAMLTMSASVEAISLGDKTEMVFSFHKLPGWALYRGKLINPSTGEVRDIIQATKIASSTYTGVYLQPTFVSSLCVAYAGLSVEDSSILGLTGTTFNDPNDPTYKHHVVVDGSNPTFTLLASE